MLGGVFLPPSLVLFFVHLVLSGFDIGESESASPDSIPPALSGPEEAPAVLGNLKLWTAIAIALILLTYTFPLAGIISDGGFFGSYETIVLPWLETAASAVFGVIP
jgi:cytochrome c oxidase subunit 1